MIYFTKQERRVLVFVAAVLFAGSVLSFVFKKYPELKDVVNMVDSAKLYPKVDINIAAVEELVAIPYIGEYTAKNIIAYREENGGFKSVEEIKKVPGIRSKNYQIFVKYLVISNQKE